MHCSIYYGREKFLIQAQGSGQVKAAYRAVVVVALAPWASP